MTYEEAKEVLENVAWLGTDNGIKVYGAIKIAIEAIEKQIPKEPILEADGYADGMLVYDTWYCPNCDAEYEVGFDEYDYCPKCGQKIDRSEVTE